MVSIIRRALACLGSANDERYESKVSGTVGDKVSANAGVATIDRIKRAFKGTFVSTYAAASRASSVTEKRPSNTRGVGRYKVGTWTTTP